MNITEFLKFVRGLFFESVLHIFVQNAYKTFPRRIHDPVFRRSIASTLFLATTISSGCGIACNRECDELRAFWQSWTFQLLRSLLILREFSPRRPGPGKLTLDWLKLK